MSSESRGFFPNISASSSPLKQGKFIPLRRQPLLSQGRREQPPSSLVAILAKYTLGSGDKHHQPRRQVTPFGGALTRADEIDLETTFHNHHDTKITTFWRCSGEGWRDRRRRGYDTKATLLSRLFCKGLTGQRLIKEWCHNTKATTLSVVLRRGLTLLLKCFGFRLSYSITYSRRKKEKEEIGRAHV